MNKLIWNKVNIKNRVSNAKMAVGICEKYGFKQGKQDGTTVTYTLKHKRGGTLINVEINLESFNITCYPHFNKMWFHRDSTVKFLTDCGIKLKRFSRVGLKPIKNNSFLSVVNLDTLIENLYVNLHNLDYI